MIKTKLNAYCYVAQTSITDHQTVFFFLTSDSYVTQASKKHTFQRIKFEKLDTCIKTIDFTEIYTYNDMNRATKYLISLLSNVILRNISFIHTPNRKIRTKPWITPGILGVCVLGTKCIKN